MDRKTFKKLLKERILIFDGAMGTMLQRAGLRTGECPEVYNLKHPDVIRKIHQQYVAAGCDVLQTNTFGANPIKLAQYGLERETAAINQQAVWIAKEASEGRCLVAGDIGPSGKLMLPMGEMHFREAYQAYYEQAKALAEAGADLIHIETMSDIQEAKAAAIAAKEASDLPVLCSMTYDKNLRTLAGSDPESAVVALEAAGADVIGVNCGFGPELMIEILQRMHQISESYLIVQPNAGIPKLVGGTAVYDLSPEEMAGYVDQLIGAGANIIGGCCGTTPAHIAKMAEAVKDKAVPGINTSHYRALATETTTVPINLDGRIMVVGERINPTGKKDMQESLRKGDLSFVARMAAEQVSCGADLLDINVGMGGIDEKKFMVKAIEEVIKTVDVPILIDTGKPEVMEAALRIYPGRAMINSVSLEKAKIEKILPLAKKYGAMFILLPLSDKGLPENIEEKKRIIHEILDKAYALGLTREDIIIDGLVNTIGANPKAALDTVETIRYCKNELNIGTIIGLSNISFGLPEREYINSTFLAFAIQAGLTMAIANPSQELIMNTALASELLLGKEGAAQRYIGGVRKSKIQEKPVTDSEKEVSKAKQSENTEFYVNCGVASGNEQTRRSGRDYDAGRQVEKHDIFVAVLQGNKREIIDLVKKELDKGTLPAEIIDKILIPAINEVGRLFDCQKYFLPQLIAGAETMKLAIDYLEPMLTSESGASRNKGTVIIATVAGDIHDIGKNLVALMLKNYGYRVIDLGKDVPAERIIAEAKKESADIIALSALMTTTMVEMENVIKKVKKEGLKAKVIIGGAVITEHYAKEIGADGYAPDAGTVPELVKSLLERKK